MRPIRFTLENLIICDRLSVSKRIVEISDLIEGEVYFKQPVRSPRPNQLYGFRRKDRLWYRAMVKFTDESKTVLHLVDRDGVHDFYSNMNNLREISSDRIKSIPAGQVKIFMHAVQRFQMRDAFKRIFDQTVKDVEVTAVFSLLERKENLVHETYAGDLIYKVDEESISFRDMLIREGFTLARHVEGSFNRGIFERRAFLFEPNNILTQLSLAENARSRNIPRSSNAIMSMDQRFEIRNEILGHGGVNKIYF